MVTTQNKVMSEAGYLEREEYEWGPGGQPSASKQMDYSSGSGSGNRRGTRFVEALEKANQYKQGIYEKAKIEKKVKDEDDDKKSSRNAFSISSDTTVRPGYEDPGFTLAGVQGRSLLGPLGAGISVFNPALGRGVSAVGGLTGL